MTWEEGIGAALYGAAVLGAVVGIADAIQDDEELEDGNDSD